MREISFGALKRLQLPRIALALLLFAAWKSEAQPVEAILDRPHFNGEVMSEYYALRFRRTRVVTDENGRGVTQWTTSPIDQSRTDFTWSNPNDAPGVARKPTNVEEWAVRTSCAGGRRFVWLNAYRNDFFDPERHNRFRIETTRAELLLGDGPWVDITDGGSCGRDGQPKALYDVTTDPYSLQVWGNLYKADGVTVGRRFYWRATMSYTPAVINSCWKSKEGRVRPAIKQEEAWWDSAKGWTLGSGAMGENGEPSGDNVVYGRWGMIGKGVGQGWRGGWINRPGAPILCVAE